MLGSDAGHGLPGVCTRVANVNCPDDSQGVQRRLAPQATVQRSVRFITNGPSGLPSICAATMQASALR
jgi:hypothetical protein